MMKPKQVENGSMPCPDARNSHDRTTDDCISRHGVSAWLDNMGYPRLSDAIMDEKRFPSAQPERKRGKWRHYEGYLICSECRTEYDDDIMTHCCDDVPNYCPNCGADMREDGHE